MRIVTFGEIMGRLTPPGFERLGQSMPGTLHMTFAGAEANVAASLATLGADAAFVTALPRNPLGEACLASLAAVHVDTQDVVLTDQGRLGLYFLETGANQRPSRVVYDRAGSSISLTTTEQYKWSDILGTSGWFHVTGITPAISRSAAETTLDAVRLAKDAGLTVSCDLNYRKKLWRWDAATPSRELAERTMRQLLPFVDLIVANEEDCGDVLGIQAEGADIHAGQLEIGRYPDVARRLTDQFPNISRVAITLRESHSASHNNWGGMLYDSEADTAFFAPLSNGQYEPYSIRNIVDRVGAGDSFAAGLIFALTTNDLDDPATAVQFAVAASCLAHSIVGDFNYSSRTEIEALMQGSASGRVIR